MNRKFKQSFGVLTLMMALALSGCGGGNGNPSADISPAGAVSTQAGSVDLGMAGNFALLAKTGIATIPNSSVTGNVGLSPTARIGLTGWSESAAADATDVYSTSDQVAAPYKLYAANYAEPTPTNLTTSVLNMEAAYSAAAGRVFTAAPYHNIDATTLDTVLLSPGIYTWDNALHITTDVYIDGSATDVWIIQVGNTLDMDADLAIILSGGALPENIFWQVAGGVTIGARSHFEGVVLGKTAITLGNLASIKGRLLAQTAINLDASTITVP